MITIVASAFVFCLAAQEKPIAKVHYNFMHVNDTTQRDKHLRDEVVTYLGQNSSYYTSYSSERLNQDLKRQTDKAGFDGNIVLSKSTTSIDRNYIFYPSQEKAIELASFGGDSFLIDSKFEVPIWEIHDESKDIGGYNCQKATTDFKGRKYTAWFTTDLPFSSGPWKLQGLPGLILTATDSREEVKFEYAGFDKIGGETQIVIEAPSTAIKSTSTEVKKLEEAFKSNPQAYLQSKQGRSGTTGKVMFGGAVVVKGGPGSTSKATNISNLNIKSVNIKSDDSYKPSKVTNNPIELTQ